ncbi:hypothetical protein [Limosilactobacillus reuteri]|nr:hypothetical protein [Limosilactobacillus reuteri]
MDIKNVAIMATSGGAGKDTVADYIVNTLMHKEGCKRALADPIHELSEKFANGKVERHHLQDFGESVRKIFGHETWIHLLDKETKELEVPLVIPDIRKLLEYSHFCVESEFLPLYVKVNPEIARERLTVRDGGFQEKDLHRNIEHQMKFIESLETEKIGKNGLRKVVSPFPFNNVYIVDNDGDYENTKKQLDLWFERVM